MAREKTKVLEIGVKLQCLNEEKETTFGWREVREIGIPLCIKVFSRHFSELSPCDCSTFQILFCYEQRSWPSLKVAVSTIL